MLPDRVMRRISWRFNNCWEWQGYVAANGYGRVMWRGKHRYAHRVVYELLVGPIPDGLTLDHLCRNRRCVRPKHLEPVTMRENNRRGVSPVAENGRKTHCKHGHEFTPENTYSVPSGGRACRTCQREGEVRYRARRRTRSTAA